MYAAFSVALAEPVTLSPVEITDFSYHVTTVVILEIPFMVITTSESRTLLHLPSDLNVRVKKPTDVTTSSDF